jgi:curved DNA-binding protein CbpA
MNNEIYKYFNLKKDASPEEVKKAYRNKVKKIHPDAEKGDREEFEKTNQFYETLINPVLRKEYDETGKVYNTSKLEQDNIPYTILSNIFESIITNMNPAEFITKDIFVLVKEKVEKEIISLQKNIDMLIESNKNANIIINRIIHKNKENIFTNLLKQKISINKIVIEESKTKIKQRKKALKILKEYNYKTDKYVNVGGLDWSGFKIPMS